MAAHGGGDVPSLLSLYLSARSHVESGANRRDERSSSEAGGAALGKRQAGNADDSMSSSKFYIPSLPGMPSDSTLTMYAGHVPSNPVVNGALDTESDAHLFFFLIKNRHIADTDRTIIWFNGGPGCSSFDGSLMEIGPLRLVPGSGGQLKEVEGAWNEYANVLFIDQPAGTGYSYVNTNSYIHELPLMATHVVTFLERWYKVFPDFALHDTYLAGESYAGQYIPYIADAILKTADLPTRLRGLMIGNGWIDPQNQYPAYLEFALQAGVVKEGSSIATTLKEHVQSCNRTLETQAQVGVHNGGTCEGILNLITDSTIQSVNGQNMCVNNYDVRLTDTHPACGMNWPPDLADITPYLQRNDVKTAFHASRKTGGWVECSGQVGANFWAAQSKPSISLFPDLLEKIPILLFAGDQDLICNYVGIENLADALTWHDKQGWGNATALEWSVDGKEAGTWRTRGNLTYVRIFQASHMAPYDRPIATHDMALRFMGVNLLGAAGPAATIPSKVGAEQEAVLGSTHPNGTAVGSGSSTDGSGALTGSEVLKHDSTIEAMVNVGSAIVIVGLMLLAGLIFIVVRRRIARRTGGGGLGMSRSRNPFDGHGKGVSLSRSRGKGLQSEPHELEELVVDRNRDDPSTEDDGMYSDGTRRKGGPLRGSGLGSLSQSEEIFRLDEEDDDDDDSGSRDRRKQRTD